ncbi:MAG: hypothetical protein HY811_08495 [Planctomycetes bacterium]|nr:hypothetical protein [Planctomycetota bacterium]
MELPILSKIKIAVFIPEEPPKGYLEKWRDSMKKAAPKMRLGIKQAISGIGDYAQKIAKPGIKEMIEWLNQGYKTKTGKNYEKIINNMLANIPKGYARYMKKVTRAFKAVKGNKADRFAKIIDAKSYWVALRRSQLVLPFIGYKDVIRGLGPFSARWLNGDLAVMELLTKQDNCYGTKPLLITAPEKAGEFRNKFVQQISKSGARIVQYDYGDKIILEENKEMNKLINKYADKGIAEFSPGKSSHVDFILEGNQLFLDIQVAQV